MLLLLFSQPQQADEISRQSFDVIISPQALMAVPISARHHRLPENHGSMMHLETLNVTSESDNSSAARPWE